MSWEDAQGFFAQLNKRVPGLEARLPTEAEWENACRAGTSRPRYAEPLDAIAWFFDNSRLGSQPVGKKAPNQWGLFDMLGNVLEWCQDRFGAYLDTDRRDPKGPSWGLERVIRGGSWSRIARGCRAATRVANEPTARRGLVGFRVSRG